MSCVNFEIKGLTNLCDRSKGGVSEVYIAKAGTFKPTVDAGAITSGTTEGFKYYYFKPQTASMSSTTTFDNANGVNYVQTVLQMVFTKMETVKRIEIGALTIGEVECIVKDANNTLWFLGFDNPVYATAATGESGTAKTDGNKYTIDLTDDSDEMPYEITSEAVRTALEAIKSGQA